MAELVALGTLWGQTSFSTHDRTLKTDEGNFTVTEPLGWLLDDHPSGVEEAMAVLYPRGTSLKTAPSVIYISVFYKEDQEFQDLDGWIKKDEASVLQEDPKTRVQAGPPLRTRLQKAAPTRFYSDEAKKYFEGVAFIEEKDLVLRLTLESGDAKIFNEDLPALQELVASYEWMWGPTGR